MTNGNYWNYLTNWFDKTLSPGPGLVLYWCYYPHTSGDSVTPVCGIFSHIVQGKGTHLVKIGLVLIYRHVCVMFQRNRELNIFQYQEAYLQLEAKLDSKYEI